MSDLRPRSAGVTAAAALALLGCATAFFFWGSFLVDLLNRPVDRNGKYIYQSHPGFFLLLAILPSALIALGIRTGIGLIQLRPWARTAALVWAVIALTFCLSLIAFRPFETFFIPAQFVGPLQSLKQLIAIALVILLFPVSVWWLILFRMKSVRAQFRAEGTETSPVE
jgi:hypothetical protein